MGDCDVAICPMPFERIPLAHDTIDSHFVISMILNISQDFSYFIRIGSLPIHVSITVNIPQRVVQAVAVAVVVLGVVRGLDERVGAEEAATLGFPPSGGTEGGLSQRHVEPSQSDAGGQQARVLLAQRPQGIACIERDRCQVTVHVPNLVQASAVMLAWTAQPRLSNSSRCKKHSIVFSLSYLVLPEPHLVDVDADGDVEVVLLDH